VTRVEEQKMDDIKGRAMEDIESKFKRTPSMEKRVFADFDSFKEAFEKQPVVKQRWSVVKQRWKNPLQTELGKMESRRFTRAASC
jgi:hypothetical protein